MVVLVKEVRSHLHHNVVANTIWHRCVLLPGVDVDVEHVAVGRIRCTPNLDAPGSRFRLDILLEAESAGVLDHRLVDGNCSARSVERFRNRTKVVNEGTHFVDWIMSRLTSRKSKR